MASYSEINAYIYEKYGKRVPTEWIAKVKEKYGLLLFYIDGESHVEPSYNVPTSAEKAILDAFTHFDMIKEK